MKRRLLTAVVAAVIYGVTYSFILYSQGQPVPYGEVLLGVGIFFVAFLAVRTWLDGLRNQREDKDNEKTN